MTAKVCKLRLFKGLVVLVSMLLFCLGGSIASLAEPSGELVLFHWWTEGGEKEAMHKAFELFEAKYPKIEIVENPVAGGGGANIRAILSSKLAAGMPPDSFNELEGYRLKAYVDPGYLAPIDEIWEELEFENTYLLDAQMMKVGGHYYGMPFHANRSNYIWYDKKLFDELKLSTPKDFDELLAICQTISEAKPQVVPLALGTRFKWPAIYVWDTIFLATVSVDFYKEFYTGRIDVSKSPEFRQALENFKELMPYMYKFHTTKTNFEAADMVVKGKAAMYLMGDWAYGRFLADGWEWGKELGGWPFPDNVWIGHPDCYVYCQDAPNPENLKLFLKHLAEPETQIALSLVKGSTACVKGVPADTYPEGLRRHNMEQLNDVSVPKLGNAFAGLTSAAFVEDWQDILAEFLFNQDINQVIEKTQKVLIRDEVAEEMSWYWE